jgi:methionine-rich copper-binding protein CopC
MFLQGSEQWTRNGHLGYRKSRDAYGSLSFSSKADSMMLQTYCRQPYGLLAALLAGWFMPLGWLMMYPGFLAAHTALVRTMPAARAVVAHPPREVRFWFNEPIERSFSRIEVLRAVLDPGTGAVQPGERIDQGWLPGPRATREVGVRLPETLAPGDYMVQWMVLAIDTHRTQGSFMFTYDPSSAP